MNDYRNKQGPIKDEAFENDAGKQPVDVAKMMPSGFKENLTADLDGAMERIKAKRAAAAKTAPLRGRE